MRELKTIVAGLEAAPEKRSTTGFTMLGEGGSEQYWPYARLRSRAREIAVALREKGVRKGDRVALILPSADEFIPTFFGVMHAGGVPVPLYPPMGLGQLAGYLDHCKHIVRASTARLLVTNPQIKAAIAEVREAAPELLGMITYAELLGDEALFKMPDLRPEDPAFIQFTSGSTSRPKGVMLSHNNLVENCASFCEEGLRTTGDDVGVSWLPLFHDMGLIGFVIAPTLIAISITLIPPMAFLKRPALWLQCLTRFKGTITYAPNFAYALAVKRVTDAEIATLDLSRVRAAGCGAEPIQAETLRAFARRFEVCGFKESAFVPSYGMAESSLAIAFARGIPTETVNTHSLSGKGIAELARPGDPSTIELVGCGKHFEGHQLKVVDLESRAEVPERTVGEIMIKGPSVTLGYFDDPEKTRETITPDGWLRTGDLGYLADGQIFICGRHKDLIIINGKNYYPQDLEWVASKVEGVRGGNVVAFPTTRAGLDREAVILVAEARVKDATEQLKANIRLEVQRGVGLVVDDVVIWRPGSIPKTSSGKVQRRKARALFESGGPAPPVAGEE